MKIDTEVLRKLPPHFLFMKEGREPNMDGVERDAILVAWVDRRQGPRRAWFAIEDGEYLTDEL